MILYNQKNCDVTRKNLGLPDCILQEGRLTGKILVPKGWSIPLSSTFDKDYVNDQIQLGNFIPILGAVEATNGTPEATTEEYQGGIISVVRNGLPQFTFKYLKGGWKFANALNTYNSFQVYDVLLVFSSGAIAGATNGTDLTGFDLGMINSNTYMFTDGSTSSSVSTTIQIINESQFNRDVALLDASVLDFNVNTDISPITDIVMTGRADVSDGKVYFKAKFAMNESSNLGGIAIPNLRVTVSGVVDTIQAASLIYDPTTQEWEFEPTAILTISTPVVVQLYDTTNVVAVAKIGVRYYKGTTAHITPVATPIDPTIPVITSGGLVTGSIGVPLSYTITATNSPTSYAIAGVPNAGLSFNSTTGVLSGTPTGSANVRVVRLDAINSSGTGSKYVEIDIY